MGTIVTDAPVYDNAGNPINGGSAGTAIHSDRGQLSQLNTPLNSTQTLQFNYWYNALDQRVRKSGDASVIASGAAHYVYDEDSRVLGEYDSAGVPLYEVIWMGDQPVAVVKQTRTGSASLHVQSDPIGSDGGLKRYSQVLPSACEAVVTPLLRVEPADTGR